jgi:hypothetical protein
LSFLLAPPLDESENYDLSSDESLPEELPLPEDDEPDPDEDEDPSESDPDPDDDPSYPLPLLLLLLALLLFILLTGGLVASPFFFCSTIVLLTGISFLLLCSLILY